LNEPYSPSENQDSADTRQIFLQSLDRQRRKLQLESLHLARRIYVEKPGEFEGRLAGYWHAWKLKSHGKNRGNAGSEQVKKSGVAGVQELQNETAAFRSVDGD
jgi:hypothetical protein